MWINGERPYPPDRDVKFLACVRFVTRRASFRIGDILGMSLPAPPMSLNTTVNLLGIWHGFRP
jgi:hypothetical protein